MPPLPWQQIDTVLLDMDGTLLDLHFDNHFWLTHLPQRYAEHHGVSLALAQAELLPLFRQHAGTLNWYCTDFWSRELRLSIRDLKREVFVVLLLDTRHQLLCYREMFQGTIDATSVHTREIVRLALLKDAAAVIVAHNHPSGVAEPSLSDIAITQKIKAALELMEIRLLDHFIIGRGQVTSLADTGRM